MFVRAVDAVNKVVGKFSMYLVFAMMGILLFESIPRTLFDNPYIWVVEMAQFTMAAYYLLGGGYSMILKGHVRMDLLYGRWSPKKQGLADSITSLFDFLLDLSPHRRLFQYRICGNVRTEEPICLGTLLAPIKIIMGLGVLLMMLQAIATLFKDIAKARGVDYNMSYELIAILIFTSMMLMLLTGQRVFGAIGGVATLFALLLWGKGASQMPFNASFALLNWYPLLTLPLFIYMGYMFSESGIASDLYKMFHVWMGPINGGLAIGTMGLMVAVSAMNGLSVAGMAIGASLALPEMLKRKYDKVMVTGVIQAGSSLGIMVPPSVVLVLYGMIARQPVGPIMAGRCFPRTAVGRSFYCLHLYPLQTSAAFGPGTARGRATDQLGAKVSVAQSRNYPIDHHFFYDGVVPAGHYQPGGMFCCRCRRDHPHCHH